MKFLNQKSAQDFTGLALSKNQQKAVKGGSDATKADADWIVVDDVIIT